jgi:hypothetical protein
MLAVDDLERAGYQAVVVATPDTQGRPVGRQLPLRRFLEDPMAGVEVSSYALVYDRRASLFRTVHLREPKLVTMMFGSNPI